MKSNLRAARMLLVVDVVVIICRPKATEQVAGTGAAGKNVESAILG